MDADRYGGTVCSPGILAYGETQFAPLIDTLPGRVETLTYQGRLFDPTAETARAVQALLNLPDEKRPVLVGASLGGMLTPFIIEQIRERADAIRRPKVVIVDAPSGGDTMMALPAWSQGFVASPMGWMISPVGLIRIGPKDDEITVPADESEDDWKRHVKAEAKQGLKGHSILQWWSQLRWMIQVGRDGSLARACKALEGLDATYLACIHPGNGVVHQPEALKWWMEHVSGLKVRRVHATHCGFLQNKPEFVAAFGEILAS